MILGLTAEEPEVEQKRTKRTKDFLESTSRFVSGRHLCCPCHEPTKGPPGFGLRQSSGAFRSGLGAQKRQRTAAVQDAIATDAPASAVHGPNACAKTKGWISMNQRSLPKRNSVHHCRRIHPQSRPFTATIAPDKNVGPGRLHWCPWTVRLRPCREGW